MTGHDIEAGPDGAPQPAPVAPGSGLAGRARLAIAWSTGFQLFRDLLQFGLTLVLVRLLPAEAYGQFGFLTTLLSFLTLYSFREFLGHTLQARDHETVHYQDHFTAGLVIQIAIFLIANLVAVALRWVPAYAPVAPILHVMSILFLLDLPSEFRVKMLERALDWRRLRLLHGLALLAGGALSVALAVAGWGVYALLLPTLLVPLPFAYDLFVREGWRPDWSWRWERFKPSWRFGAARIAAGSFAGVAIVLESSWLTGALGFAVLGLVGRATGLAQLLCGRLAGLLALSVYPILTRIPPGTDTYRRASAMYLRTILWTVVPAAVVAALLAAPLVQVLYGNTWLEAIPMVPWTMAGAAVAAAAQTGYTLLLAHGRQDRCLRADMWRLAGTVVILLAVLPLGIERYLMALVAVHLVSLALVMRWLMAAGAVSRRGLADAFTPPMVSAAVAGAILFVVRAVASPAGDSVAGPILSGAAFTAAYLVCLRLAFVPQLRELVAYLPERQRISRLLRLQQAT